MTTSYTHTLQQTLAHALSYLDSLSGRHIATGATPEQLRAALGRPLPENGMQPESVIGELVRDVEGGVLASSSSRFFGWVIGGAVPAALAADWLTSTWDQNAAAYACAPAEAIVEEVAGGWLKELLGIPETASFGFVTGCQQAHTTALAAARHQLLADRGWDVEQSGLCGAPPIHVLTTALKHESLVRAVRMLGIGENAIEHIQSDNEGRMLPAALRRRLESLDGKPALVCLQAGDLNTGVFDPFNDICDIAHDCNAWVHIDGAFGLWVATSESHKHFLNGAEKADSWATDGHKWLNVPFDSGFVFVANPEPHFAAMSLLTSYEILVDNTRSQKDWNPEWSRRGRGFATYAAIRSLGKRGIAEIVDGCCRHAQHLVTELGKLPEVEVLALPRINQGLLRFLADDGDHDKRTDDVIEKIQESGKAWFGATTWHDMRVMRVSVCNWQTTTDDIDATIEAVRAALS
ncbi:MAG: pyridoxal phosphate-dependent decarboxylase family protein [Gammaproteobacteria bacterium]